MNETQNRAPTLCAIILIKLLKGSLFLALALAMYTLSDNDLPAEFRSILHHLRLNPERKFLSEIALQLATVSETKVLWAAAATAVYSLFSLVEGVGLIFRVSWAGWLAIGESAFFIPIEAAELTQHPTWMVWGILALNLLIVWYLLQNRKRLFGHHSHAGSAKTVRPPVCAAQEAS